jgi:Galactosyltransferase
MIYSLQAYNPITADVDIRFVFCNLATREQQVFIALEIMRFNDIIIMNCTENMNNGKTYQFLSGVPELFSDRPYDYVMKADDDAYIRLDSLVESLKDKSRVDMYYGLVMPCDKENFFPFPPFMSGMGYVLSWDLIEWMAQSDFRRDDTEGGPEDMWTGKLLNFNEKAKNRYGFIKSHSFHFSSHHICFDFFFFLYLLFLSFSFITYYVLLQIKMDFRYFFFYNFVL